MAGLEVPSSASKEKIFSRHRSCRGVRGGVLKKLQGFEKIAEESDLPPLAARLLKEEAPPDADSPGKIVIYTTSMKAVRDTYYDCLKVTRLFQTLRVRFIIKDILLHPEFLGELQERVEDEDITVPQVFINGTHIGDAEIVLDMNECGELAPWLEKFQREYVPDCSHCDGRGFVPCLQCKGSKKGKRGAFTTLRCSACNQHGLQPCPGCADEESLKTQAAQISALARMDIAQTGNQEPTSPEKERNTSNGSVQTANAASQKNKQLSSERGQTTTVVVGIQKTPANVPLEEKEEEDEEEEEDLIPLPPEQFQDVRSDSEGGESQRKEELDDNNRRPSPICLESSEKERQPAVVVESGSLAKHTREKTSSTEFAQTTREEAEGEEVDEEEDTLSFI